MFNESVFMQENILERTLQAYSMRNEVIQNNIANNDTPNFKKSVVSFEATLTNALNSYKTTGKFDLSSINPETKISNTNLSMRLDGNNVDIEAENVDLYRNAALLDVISNSITTNYKILNIAITSR